MKIQLEAVSIELTRHEAQEIFEALETLKDEYSDICYVIKNPSIEKLRVITKRLITTQQQRDTIKDIQYSD